MNKYNNSYNNQINKHKNKKNNILINLNSLNINSNIYMKQ